MSIKVAIKPLETNIPGQAQVLIKGWEGTASGLEFKVQRNQDMGYLNGSTGKWSNSEYWFKLNAVEQVNEDLLIHIGSDLLDPLIENVSAAYNVTLRDAEGFEDHGRVRVAGGLLASTALGGSKAHEASGALATPEVPTAIETAVETAESEPPPAPEPEIETATESVAQVQPETAERPADGEQQTKVVEKKGKAKTAIWVLLGLLLLLIIAGLAWWFVQKKGSLLGGAASPVSASHNEQDADIIPCSSASMGQMDELQFVQSCLQESKSSQDLLTIIQQAKSNNHCGIAQRLYANRAQSGDSLIALAYAKEYDPKFYAANDCFKAADVETAVYWYETVLLSEPEHAEAAQRIEELTQ